MRTAVLQSKMTEQKGYIYGWGVKQEPVKGIITYE